MCRFPVAVVVDVAGVVVAAVVVVDADVAAGGELLVVEVADVK